MASTCVCLHEDQRRVTPSWLTGGFFSPRDATLRFHEPIKPAMLAAMQWCRNVTRAVSPSAKPHEITTLDVCSVTFELCCDVPSHRSFLCVCSSSPDLIFRTLKRHTSPDILMPVSITKLKTEALWTSWLLHKPITYQADMLMSRLREPMLSYCHGLLWLLLPLPLENWF